MATLAESRREAYVGEKKKQLRDGFGVYVYENKFFKYEGEWKNGIKHGHGKLSMADGSYYEGEFTNGEIDGHGYRYFGINGNSYSGQFSMGELHGQGVMKYKNGSVYEGEWHRNVRQGYGIYRCFDNSVYQGYLHNHQRHGEGTQIYSNGDRYDGDWIKDKRQGHGQFKERDGTVYDGQWQNNLYNGQGAMNHSSGMYYEGLWVNGKPAVMSKRLEFKNPDPIEIMQGMQFGIEVLCVDEDGQLVEGDMGREIQVIAGYKYTPPQKEEGDVVSKENSSTGLFDMIEDVEEKPIPTPFGYSIIPYPLTDQFPYEENDEALLGLGSRANTTMSEMIAEDTSNAKETEKAKEEEPKEVDTTEQPAEAPEGTEVTTTDETQTASDPQDQAQGGEERTAGSLIPEVPLPPPVSNRRCDHGTVAFSNLVLSAAPPMYRPFTQMEDAEKKPTTSKSRQSKRSEAPEDLMQKPSSDEQSRPATRSKSREKTNLGDDRFARGGDYVIMAQDVTTPPFIGFHLEPAFLLVKVNVPKKPKKPKKDTRPNGDRPSHI